MDSALLKTFSDKSYEKRKVAALDVEKLTREAVHAKDHAKIANIINSLAELAHSPNALARSGGIMGLAGVSIALGTSNIARHLAAIVPPVLACFTNTDNKVRYFACESMYNVAKVAKGEILVYFNELFDALAKLAADTEVPVKNGAELLDRLIKDIVSEQAATYVSVLSDKDSTREGQDKATESGSLPTTAFSLARFIPLLKERILVINPFTRMYLVSWLTVLDSVPEIELIAYLPEFLEGLINFLSDPTAEIKTATQNLLADFLREIKEVAEVQAAREARWKEQQQRRLAALDYRKFLHPDAPSPEPDHVQTEDSEMSKSNGPSVTTSPVIPEADEQEGNTTVPDSDDEGDGLGLWEPGQGVVVKHAEIVEILLKQMSYQGPEADQEIQAVCLRWIAAFLSFAQDVIIPFTPRLIPLVMSALAHHVPSLRQAAHNLNVSLFQVISELPSPPRDPKVTGTPILGPSSLSMSNASSEPVLPTVEEDQRSVKEREKSGSQQSGVPFPSAPSQSSQTQPVSRIPTLVEKSPSRPATRVNSPEPMHPQPKHGLGDSTSTTDTVDPFDYQATVSALCTLLGVEEEESRLAALHWLSMLHAKAPRKILSLDDGTFPALLKTLSDPSEEVIKSDLQLLAQISSSSSEEYFTSFMINLVRLFSTDRPLLEHRGRTIVGQLCINLNTEKIYRTFAEILEKDEDLEFASLMIQNLNLFLITLPELADFRKRLKNIDTKDGSALFSALYRSWSHNAVSTLCLCFLAQAYEHASNLLQIFAELEMNVGLLVQIDKLVQLLESTVFTSLRLQLLEPEKNPFLLKALYGILMLLPQSTAFVTLRNRLNSVSALGFLHAVPRAPGTYSGAAAPTRSTMRRQEEIKWQDLLSHFRNIQLKHEKQRRLNMQQQNMQSAGFSFDVDVQPLSNGPIATSNAPMLGSSSGIRSNTRKKAIGGTFARGTTEAAVRAAPLGRTSGKAHSVTASLRALSPPATNSGAASRRSFSHATTTLKR